MTRRSMALATGLALSLTALGGGSSRAGMAPATEVQSETSTVRVVVYFYDAQDKRIGSSTGTGSVVAPGTVITNRHVLLDPKARALEVFVIPDRRSGTQRLHADLIDRSVDFDLALLRVKDLKAPAFPLASDPALKGSAVSALGYPGKIDDVVDSPDDVLRSPSEPYLTEGNVALLSDSPVIGGSRIPVIFHTAAINGGNSGGPLVDDCGRLVGVNTGGVSTTLEDDGVGVDLSSGQFIASGTPNLVVFLQRAHIAPILDPRRCDHGRLVAVRPEAPAPSSPTPAFMDAVRAALKGAGWENTPGYRLARTYLIQISGSILAFGLIYFAFLRARMKRAPAPSCPLPAASQAPDRTD